MGGVERAEGENEGGSEMSDEINIASPSIAAPMHILKTVEMKVTLSEETLKELFAAIALQKLMPQQQVADYVTSARELAAAMMKARKEDSK
jgi:hypothetical protein